MEGKHFPTSARLDRWLRTAVPTPVCIKPWFSARCKIWHRRDGETKLANGCFLLNLTTPSPQRELVRIAYAS